MSDSTLMGRRVLVTGAGGFIGSHLCEALVAGGAAVTALVHYRARDPEGWLRTSPVRRDLRIESGDVTDRDSLRPLLCGIDTVFHLAALISIPHSHRSPTAFIRTQIEGTANVVIESALASARKVLVVSTSEVYGTARAPRIDEGHPTDPRSPYAATKLGAEAIARTLAEGLGTDVAIVRPFNTYGPRQSARAIIPSLMCQARAGHEVQVGNLHPTRDFTFVTDTVRGLIATAASQERGLLINLGSGQEIAIGDLIRLIGDLAGRRLAPRQDPQRIRQAPTEVDRLCADAGRARSRIGWEPTVPLRDGLERTWDWVCRHADTFDPDRYER
jgi:dTDP-glucose 4,6-dehydratase